MFCHHSHTLHWGNAQPDQLRLLHQLSFIRCHYRGASVLPLEETQLVSTHQGMTHNPTGFLSKLMEDQLTLFNSYLYLCPGKPAGSCELPDVLGFAAWIQSVLRASGMWCWSGNHADRSTRLLPGCPLERKTKVYLQHDW